MSVARWIAHRAGSAPDKVALHLEGADTTYAELDRRVGRLAAGLAQTLALGRGDRVAFLGYNSPELLELLFACARLAAILVPLNWRLAVPEHAAILGDCAPRALFVEPEFDGQARELVARLPGLRVVACGPREGVIAAPTYQDLLAAAPSAPGESGLDDPLLLVYTSGTTGRPRGAVLTQGALLHNALNSIAAHDMTSADHVLTVLPMFHVGGLNIQTTPALYAGATVTLARRFDAGETLDLLARRRPTLFLSVPTVALALSGHARFAGTDLSSLRCMATGSSVVPEAVMRPWLARGVPVTQVYGLTESGPTAIALPIADAERKMGSCGKPCLHTEARVVDVEGRDVPDGQAGEIWLRGPNLLREYWASSEATAEAFTGGWFHTGDIGHRDADGYYYVDDRKKDVVISGGENVYPAELEAVLADSPDIAEAAVLGRPDPRWGEVPVACVVVRPGARLSRAQVLALFPGRLARYKHPRDVVFLDALPRTVMGKVQKHELRRRLSASG